MVDLYSTKLEGVVTKEAIENKCIAFEFDEDRVKDWVNSLN